MTNLPTKKFSPSLYPRSLFSPLFEEFFGDDWHDMFNFDRIWNERMGATDVEKTTDTYTLTVDVPGLTKEDIHIDIDGDELKISAERKPREKKEGVEYLASERTYRRFERTFRIPEDVDFEKSDAKVEHGVLTLTLTRKKKAEKSAKKIEVK